ncbi:MAG TPA: hypothetical protein VGP48_13490 [Stellaceae bacterium]|nr:hypothetical protein [Stellaceae bacterium]
MALLLSSGARADSPALATPTDQAVSAAASDASGNGLRAVVTGLRTSLVDNGLSQALTRASDWVRELEVSWTAHRDGLIASGNDDDSDLAIPSSKAVGPKAAAFAARPNNLNLGLVSFGTSNNGDQVWALGHAQPLAALTTQGDAAESGADHVGRVAGERALVSHDLELGLRVPLLPWNTTITGAHYWWGARGFGPQVQGSRVALKLSPVDHVEIEGGRAEDTRGSGGFLGILYRVPLDQPE